jgi:hypothetical protein
MGTSLRSPLLFLLLLLGLALPALSQNCSKLKPCATGCCSKFGYCGTGDDFCGKDCVDTCDFRLGCDKENPCKTGCCSKFGFCGLGPDCKSHGHHAERRVADNLQIVQKRIALLDVIASLTATLDMVKLVMLKWKPAP